MGTQYVICVLISKSWFIWHWMIWKAVLTAYLQTLSTCRHSIYWQRPAAHVLVLSGCSSDSSTI